MSEIQAPHERLQLDARQRAMLEAMGISLQVWWPEPVAAATEPPPVQEPEPAPAPQRDPPTPAPAPVRDPPAPAAPVAPRAARPAPPAPTSFAAGAAGPSDVLVDAPRCLYGTAGTPGGWLVLADMAPDLLGRHADDPLTGEEGRLLDNMLRALRLHAGAVPVHLLRLHRGSALPGEGMPRPFGEAFAAHRAALAPRIVLALGPLAAQSLLGRGDPIGKLRGELHSLPDMAAVASYPLAYLLRNRADKAKAWADLCLAAAAFEQAG